MNPAGAPAAGAPTPRLALAALERVARKFPLEAIDELWVFPSHRIGDAESIVLVLSAFGEEAGRRRVVTAHFRARPGTTAAEESITEHGAAPAERIGRLVEGVLRRLDGDLAAATPFAARIAGDPARWAGVLEHFAARPESGPA